VGAWKSIQIFSNSVGENTAGLKFDAGGNKTVSTYLKDNISKIKNPINTESFSIEGEIQACNSVYKQPLQ
jgi:hypothetical protein